MGKLDILLKCIILLFRESEVIDTLNDDSKDLVKSVLSTFRGKTRLNNITGGEHDIIENLIDLIKNMLNSPESYDKLNLIQTLQLILKQNDSALSVIDKALNLESTTGGLKRSIVSLRANLNNYYKEAELTSLIKKAAYDLSMGKLEESVQDYTSKLVVNIEALSNITKLKDPGIVDEIDISDDEEMNKVITKVKNQTTGDGRFKTGWLELNTMLNGGFRRGEMVLTSALQHNYKSGFCQSLFAQLCMYNSPVLLDKNKKPLALFISLEDDSDVIANFLYRYLYNTEFSSQPDMEDVTPKEIAEYIKTKLTMTGFNVKILRVNPSDWTYKSLFNKIIEYEAAGYELEILFIDYLSKLPTTGCISSGPMGTDLRDLMNRVRNFCNNSARQVLVLTPHQLSVDCKQLLRNGISGQDLVKEIANKGYYEGSRQIDQVVDLEIHQHIARIGKNYYLTMQRGKRRYPEIIDDEKKYFMLPFPYKAPIPPNITLDGKYIGFKYSPEDTIIKTIDDEFEI